MLEIRSAESTDLFVGSEDDSRQVIKITVANAGSEPVDVTVALRGQATSPQPAAVSGLAAGGVATVELGVVLASAYPDGTALAAEVVATCGESVTTRPVEVTAAEPGWTMFMVNHFHYDPVWWNTQAAYTESWQDARMTSANLQFPAFTLVKTHLDLARRDPDYKFVLAEIDYLKPYWDYFPEDRAYLRQLIREGRLEYVGGMYNEPSPVLTSAELTIRNVIYGIGYQRDVLGGDPASAWMLDVFGHDPQFPGICAAAGLTSSSWARGPHHEWGPKKQVGTNTRMQFASEFDWVAPSGLGVLTSYMPNHYSAGWWMDAAPDLEAALDSSYELFQDLKPVAATKNVLLPVGTDYTPPNRWVTRIHREWARRYVWPKFVTATASDFFTAVRTEAAERGIRFSPQTRDMNPIFTGCYVSYIDTKQAQREAENTLLAAEKFATVAALLGARYPAAALDKAWRQLCYGAHHDGITGSESDQVYLDLMGGWREAYDLAHDTLLRAQEHCADQVATRDLDGTPLVVFNPSSWPRADVVWTDVSFPAPGPAGMELYDAAGEPIGLHVEQLQRHGDRTLASAKIAFIAADVPATGYAAYQLVHSTEPIAGPTWRPRSPGRQDGATIENEHYRVEVDPAQGGAIAALLDKHAGKEMLKPARVGNELLAYDEYADPPGGPGDSPWVTAQRGAPVSSSVDKAANVVVEVSPIGQRITVRGSLPSSGGFVQEISCWRGVARIECTTRIDDFAGSDTMLRVRFPAAVEGGLPVSETAAAVTGRTFGFPNADYADATWTLDYPANNWVEVGHTLVVRLSSGAARAVNVAELIVDDVQEFHDSARAAVTALVRRGVTATTSTATGSRYGALDVDSNLPDFRISVGAGNAFTRQVLDAADRGYADELGRQLAATGTARVWVPAEQPLADVWQVKADLRSPRALPVVIVAGRDTAGDQAALEALAADIDARAVIDVTQPAALDGTTGNVEDYGFAVLNRGLPGFNVDTSGDIYLGLLRSATGWPSGVWIDPPRRTLPNGANFQTNNWSHTFSYSIVGHRGDWRSAGLVRHGHEFNNPLTACQTDRSAGSLPPRLAFLETNPVITNDSRPDTSPIVRDHGDVVVTVLKPRGNPLASQSGSAQDPTSEGIAVRLVETSGQPARVRLRFVGEMDGAVRTDLLEAGDLPLDRDRTGAVTVDLDGFEIATVAAALNFVDLGEVHGQLSGMPAMDRALLQDQRRSGTLPLAPEVEPVQPVYSQYWRHNTGAAPIGGQPLTVRLTPETVTGPGPFQFSVAVAGEHTVGTYAGTVQLILPDGWTADSIDQPYSLPPSGWMSFSTLVQPTADAEPGRYFVAARLTDEHGAGHESVAAVDLPDTDVDLPDAVFEPNLPANEPALALDRNTRKAHLVQVPRNGAEPAMAPGAELEATWLNPGVLVQPGESSELAVRLVNHALSEVRGEAQLITPYALWPMTSPRHRGFAVPPRGEEIVRFDVDTPADAKPGSGWALVKLGYFGQIAYTEAVPVRVGWDDGSGRADRHGALDLRSSVAPTAEHALDAAAVRPPIIPSHLAFDAGTPDERLWLWEDDAALEPARPRVGDGDRHFSYRFGLPPGTTGGEVSLDFAYLIRVEASPDGKTWTEVVRERRDVGAESAAPVGSDQRPAAPRFDLAPFLDSETAYVRVHHARPVFGWQGRVGRVEITLQRSDT